MTSLHGSIALLALLAASCGARPNPSRPLVLKEVIEPLPRTERVEATTQPALVPDVDPATDPAPSPPSETTTEARSTSKGSATLIGRVAGREVDAGELLALWMLREPETGREIVEQLVVSRLAEREAQRLGLTVSEEEIEVAFAESLARRDRDVREASDLESLDAYLQSRGIDTADYRARQRELTGRALLTERVVRAWSLCQERLTVRAILVRDEAALEEVRSALDAGESFAAVAERLSVEASRTRGGVLPPIVRSDLPISRLAFASRAGEVAGPLDALGGKLIITVEERLPARDETAPGLAQAVRDSLAEAAIEPYFEFDPWQQAMARRYEVDLKPLRGVTGLGMR